MTITLIGFPWDASSSYARGPALAPPVICAALNSAASSPYSLNGTDIREAIKSYVLAELPGDAAACRNAIEAAIEAILEEGGKPISLGGDHSITYPVLHAVKKKYGAVNVLHIDAHPDLYDEFNGDRYSHACPFARALEDGCIGNLVQLGIRSASPDQRAFGKTHDAVMLGADEVDLIPYERLQAPLYVSIDLDGLDPAFAPGVSHPEPGGLSTRDVLSVLSKLPAPPVGADIVELNPANDINLATANVAARFAKELAACMA